MSSLRSDRKTRESDEKKKAAAADRLKHEMDFIGISLNNVIPAVKGRREISSSDTDSDADNGQRRSKKKALKRVMQKTRQLHRHDVQLSIPVLTVTEGRSKRPTTKVDYNFQAYDEQLQEAMKQINPSINKTNYDYAQHHMPVSGLGRGKDMRNIIDLEKKRKESANGPSFNESHLSKKNRQTRKLTDLDIDNATESETDEYEASSIGEEDPEPSEEEYLPSERTR